MDRGELSAHRDARTLEEVGWPGDWPEPLEAFADEIDRFHTMLQDLSNHLTAVDPSNLTNDQPGPRSPDREWPDAPDVVR